MAFVVRGKSGKVVGTYATRGEAERRIAQLKAGAERLRRFQFAGGRRAMSPSSAKRYDRRAQRSPAYSLTRIRLNRGGYTSNGRYFGSGGAPVYQLMANDVYVFRAPIRAEAVATAKAITNLEESGAGMTDILWKAKRVNPTVGKW